MACREGFRRVCVHLAATSSSGSNPHGLKMFEQTRVRLPPVELNLARHTQLVFGGWRVILEELRGTGAPDDHTGVTVAGRQDGGTSCVEVEGLGVAAAGERMPHYDDVELASLQAVGGVDDD